MANLSLPSKKTNRIALVLCLCSSVAFLAIGELLLFEKFFIFIDPMFFQFLDTLSHPLILGFFITLSEASNPLIFFLIALAFFFLLLVRKKRFHSVWLVLSLLCGSSLFLSIKFLFQIERPMGQLLPVSGFSFPSGHATLSAIFFIVLFISLRDEIKNKYTRAIFGFFCIAFPSVIGLSRIYLHLHRLSDVLAGFFLGIAVVSFFYFVSNVLFSFFAEKKSIVT